MRERIAAKERTGMGQNATNEVNETAEREYLKTLGFTVEDQAQAIREETYKSLTDEEVEARAKRRYQEKLEITERNLRMQEYEARYKARAHNESWRDIVYKPLRPAEIRDSAAERIAGMLVQQSPDMAPAAIASRAYDIACALREEAARRDAK